MVSVMVRCARWGLPWLGALAMSAVLTAAVLLCMPGDETLTDCDPSLTCGITTTAVPLTPGGADPLRPGSGQYEIGGPSTDD